MLTKFWTESKVVKAYVCMGEFGNMNFREPEFESVNWI
jgi:hypothetical protein